ncbi:MAG: restriction endonuclease subunit S [Ruminococcus sp.]|nr:restriction endonuclease subunit S [Ruminococcus sp.]
MQKVRIGDYFDVYDGAHATPKKTEDGPVYLGIDAVTNDGKINPDGYAHLSVEDYYKWSKRVKPQFGDLVFSYEATLGRYALIPEGFYGCLGRRLALLRAKTDRFNIKWLYYYFLSPEWTAYIINHTVKGSTVNRISVEDFPDFEIPDTDRLVQDSIVDVLSTIDAKVDLNKAVNDNLQHQLKLMYDYWFTQFDFPDENGKPYRASGGAMVWNEQLKREIPLYWSIGTVSDCVEKISTGLNPRDNFVLGNGSIRYITVKNLTTTGSLDFSGCDMIDEEARAIVHRRSDISVGDILFASIAPLGRCYLIQQDPVDWDINESVFSIRSKTDTVTPEFMYLYFQSDSFIQKATNTSTGSIFKGIRINTLLDTALIVPELQVCKSFTDAVKPLLAEINNNSSETAKLTALRDWLLPMLMNGQATISD